jgi:hypothetical protein
MKNIVGSPARGNNFYQRNREIQNLIYKIQSGNNIQIAAPRRIGKTSILHYLKDNQIEGYYYVFIDTESIDNETDFYKKLFQEIIKSDSISKSKKLINLLNKKSNKFLDKIKSVQILGSSIELNESTTNIDYYEDLQNLLCGLELENNKRIILLIDEFPQTIQNIIDNNKEEGEKNAIKFLQTNRQLRQNPAVSDKVTFIYTGSIGLTYTVSKINSTAFINDLNSVEVLALEPKEGIDFLRQLLLSYKETIGNKVAEYLMQKIEWLVPFHIQLAVQEIMAIKGKAIITKEIVDQAFTKIVEARNNNHFDHYYSRLRTHFKKEEVLFSNELLQKIADENTLTKGTIYDLSVKYHLEAECKRILETLVYDGYINNNDDVNSYRFNSPILRMWWQKYICK